MKKINNKKINMKDKGKDREWKKIKDTERKKETEK